MKFPFLVRIIGGICLTSAFINCAFSLYAQEQVTQPKPKPKLTPEQRAAAKQRDEERKNELALKRRETFAVLPENDDSPLAKEYQSSLLKFRESMSNLDQVRTRQQFETDFSKSKRDEILVKWTTAIAEGNNALATWLSKAGEIYASDPDKYQQIGEALSEMMLADTKLDKFDPWLAPAKALIGSNRFNNEANLLAAGMVGLANADFDFVEQCWTTLQQEGKLPGIELSFFGQLASLKEKWKREQEIRQKEAEKADNPRVELMTSKGKIIVELYEDSAPEAVASFIYLVEKGYYNFSTFFRVEQHVCAQAGCEKGDGTGSPGYIFAGEANHPEHRDHFRGSLTLALGSDKNTGQIGKDSGGSQFFFSFLPMPYLDGTYTVFGRIVEGQPCINLFRVMNLANEDERKNTSNRPDSIMSAKVVRKRSHEYRPNILAGKLR